MLQGLGASEKAPPILTLLDERVAAAWRHLPRRGRPPLMALVPNVRGMIREATERGMVGAGISRALRAGPLRLAMLGFVHLPDIPAVLRKDFPTLLRGLCGVEAAEASGLRADGLILQPQMTDLALAMDNPRMLWDFLRLAERQGRAAGLATNNPAALLARLAEAPAPKSENVRRYIVPMCPRRPAPDSLPEAKGWTWVKLRTISDETKP
jgi:hypothetical protein